MRGGSFHSALSLGGTGGGETFLGLYLFSYLLKWVVSQGNSVFILQATGFFLPFKKKYFPQYSEKEACDMVVHPAGWDFCGSSVDQRKRQH